LQTGKWQHVVATCTAEGLMRVYLDGMKVAEAQGKHRAPTQLSPNRQVDLARVLRFYRALVKAGLQETYEAAAARTSLELLVARQARFQHPPPLPDLGSIPACNRQAVDALYFNTARWIAGGMVDRLAGRSVWREPANPQIVALARQQGLLED
jgi:hypothetical protein